MCIRCSSTDSSSRVSASSAENGSSINMTRGRWISERHSATRCCIPPDSSCGSRRGSRRADHRQQLVRVVECSRRRQPNTSIGSSTLSRTERHGSSAGRWSIIATSRRGAVTSAPPMYTEPRVGSSNPATSRSRVDLPHPNDRRPRRTRRRGVERDVVQGPRRPRYVLETFAKHRAAVSSVTPGYACL